MMAGSFPARLLLIAGLAAAAAASAQVAVDFSDGGVRVQSRAGGSVAANTAGTIDPDVEMEGVAVINGEVFIDGEKVPRNRSTFKARKSGKTYRITRGGDGSVAVQEK